MARLTAAEERLLAESPLLTVQEVAVYLRTRTSWVRRLIAAGKLPFQIQGKAHLVIRRDVDAYIERCRVHDDSQKVVKTGSETIERTSS